MPPASTLTLSPVLCDEQRPHRRDASSWLALLGRGLGQGAVVLNNDNNYTGGTDGFPAAGTLRHPFGAPRSVTRAARARARLMFFRHVFTAAGANGPVPRSGWHDRRSSPA